MCNHTLHSRRRLLITAGIGALGAVAGTNAGAAGEDGPDSPESPEARLRDLLSERRSLRLHRGDERVEATYWTRENGYNRDEYLNICWLLRDTRADRVFPINHALLDVLSGVQAWLVRTGVNATLRIHSGYRTPKTNKATEGAALDSRHVVGRAVDISVDGVPNIRLAQMASLLGRGGTGFYPGRSFVHVDTGDERIWIDRPRKSG